MSEEPPPPTERSCQTDYLRDLLCAVEKNTFPSFCSSSKVLFQLICSLALRLMIHFISTPRPAASTAYFPTVCTRRPRHFTTPPLGLLQLVRSSSAPAPPATPPLLLSTSVGHHNPRPPSTLCGELVVVVFAAYSDFPFGGTITIFDGTTCKYIYTHSRKKKKYISDFTSQKQEWLTRHADSSGFKSKLLLTGPDCAISAYDGFIIFASIPGTDEEYNACYRSRRDYSHMLNHPTTVTIATNMGSLYVTCAVLSGAVSAHLEVMVRLPWVHAFAHVHGRVTAYIGTFEIGITIFSREDEDLEYMLFTDEEEHDGLGTEFSLPLEQSTIGVPIGSCLHIKGELILNGYQTISIDHSIPTDSHDFETGWDEDEDFEIQTAARLSLRSIWI